MSSEAKTIPSKFLFNVKFLSCSQGSCESATNSVEMNETENFYNVIMKLIPEMTKIESMVLNYVRFHQKIIGVDVPLGLTLKDYFSNHQELPKDTVHSLFFLNHLMPCPPDNKIGTAMRAYEKKLKWPLWSKGDCCPVNMQALGSSDDIQNRRGQTIGYDPAEVNFPGKMLGVLPEGTENITFVNTACYLNALLASTSESKLEKEMFTRQPIQDPAKFVEMLQYIVIRQAKGELNLPILQLPQLEIDERYHDLFLQDSAFIMIKKV